MTNLVETLYSWLSFVRHISLRNLLEIVIIAFLVYEILLWIKNTRAWTLLKGIAVILGFTVFVYVLRLDTIFWIMTRLAFVATTALVIIFQPELRKALEELGSQNLISGIFSFDDGKESQAFTERSVNPDGDREGHPLKRDREDGNRDRRSDQQPAAYQYF